MRFDKPGCTLNNKIKCNANIDLLLRDIIAYESVKNDFENCPLRNILNTGNDMLIMSNTSNITWSSK